MPTPTHRCNTYLVEKVRGEGTENVEVVSSSLKESTLVGHGHSHFNPAAMGVGSLFSHDVELTADERRKIRSEQLRQVQMLDPESFVEVLGDLSGNPNRVAEAQAIMADLLGQLGYQAGVAVYCSWTTTKPAATIDIPAASLALGDDEAVRTGARRGIPARPH